VQLERKYPIYFVGANDADGSPVTLVSILAGNIERFKR